MADGSPSSLPRVTPDLAFGALYREHAGMVRRALRQLGVPPGSLDDAVQDVFVVLHRRIDDFERDRSLKNWLWGIARGVASGYRRSQQRRDRLHAALPAPEGPGLPERGVARREAAAILHDFLGSLDEDKCAVFVLSELEGRRGPEIAAQLDVNLNTVYARLRAARQRFDDAMARHREPGRRPLLAALLPWTWTGWLGKPVAAVGALAIATAVAVGSGAVTTSTPADDGAHAARVAEASPPALVDDGASAPRWPRSVVPATTPVLEPDAVEIVDEDEVVLLEEPEATPRTKPRTTGLVPDGLADASRLGETEALEQEPMLDVGPPQHAPWSSTVQGRPAVRHPTLLSLREDFIAELLRVASRM